MFVLMLAMACDDEGPASRLVGGGDDVEELDETPPLIEDEPPPASVVFGQDHEVVATITDEESDLFLIQLHYKPATSGSGDWRTAVMMSPTADSVYRGTIPGASHTGSGFHYYVMARDTSQNEATVPTGGADDPYLVRLTE